MERIKPLDRYQKGILLFLAAMVVIFGVLYAVVTSRVGFLYKDAILQPVTEQGNTIYSGKIKGQECRFTVTADKVVTFQCEDKTYGPYTMREDPSAIPEGEDVSELMRGIEMKKGDEVIFRGGIYQADTYWMMMNEDRSFAGFSITATTSDGVTYDENGNIVDPMEPDVSDILFLIDGPELTNKGAWIAWFLGVFISVITALSILYADELFRWNLSFQIRNAECAEPSDWEIAGRYIGWTVLTGMAFVICFMGLWGVSVD